MNKKFLIIFLLLGGCAKKTKVAFQETNDHVSLSKNFLKKMNRLFNPDYFFETGTFYGTTTVRAAKIFPQVYTVELSKHLYYYNNNYLQSYNNIHTFCGHSLDVLEQILPAIKDHTGLFFLDAHYSGDGTAKGEEITPLIQEIRKIGENSKTNVILIDDLRNCHPSSIITKQLQLNPDDISYGGYPSLNEIKNELLKINPHYELVIYGDLGIAYPKDKYPYLTFSPIIEAMTTSRLLYEHNILSQKEQEKLLECEQCIMHASGKEKKAIKNLLLPSEGRDKPLLYAAQYKLWNALVYMNENQYINAIKLLEEIDTLELKPFRYDTYISVIKDTLSLVTSKSL